MPENNKNFFVGYRLAGATEVPLVAIPQV